MQCWAAVGQAVRAAGGFNGRPRFVRVRAWAVRDGGGVRIAVQDEGIGMDADTVLHAFDPFFTTRVAADGTGLGLAIVKRLAEEAGGSVRIDSSPGIGTEVTIGLPAAEPAGAGSPWREFAAGT